MMGVWFLWSSVSHYVAGLIAAMASIEGGSQAASVDSLQVYSTTFLQVAEIATVVALGVLVLTPVLKRRMHVES
jgi:dipeptide/tripeptide permease